MSLLISTTQHDWVAHYHPICGLKLFDDRRRLKRYLLDRLASPDNDPGLSYLLSQAERRLMRLGELHEMQVTLMEGSVYDTLMLDIQHRLSEQLREWRQLLLDQPSSEELVSSGSEAAMASLLAHYWR
ncbi:hypothetical protein, partial [Pseudomonas viridiflava]|uniref:hypothetical protein n=1 Tax=Pseudomonas viridiflava TaxID=33069 RepID=UPI0013CE43AA